MEHMKNVILLNNLFNGEYIKEKVGGEIINMYQSDNENYYVYINPYGNIEKKWDERIKYVIFIRTVKNGFVKIIGKAEIIEQVCLNAKFDKKNNKIDPNQKKYIEKDKIKYGGAPISSLGSWSKYFITFKANCIYKPKSDIYLSTDSNKSTLYENIFYLKDFKKIANQSQKFNRPLKTSTITNYNASLNRIFDIAISKDWMSKSQVPPLNNKGVKGERRPAFSVDEWIVMMRALRTWQNMGQKTVTRNMRELLRDYVLIMTNTGMRYGTESQNIKWKHINWFMDKDSNRYLMIAVDGKTGRRELIARHNVLVYLIRIQSRFADLNSMTFDELLEAKLDVHVFRLRNGLQTNNLNQSFEQFLKFVGLLKDKFGDNRTLYSLRHTYATMTLMRGQVGIHDLARQMGTSVIMIERHYSHLNSAMKAKSFS
jgi:integrase